MYHQGAAITETKLALKSYKDTLECIAHSKNCNDELLYYINDRPTFQNISYRTTLQYIGTINQYIGILTPEYTL